MNKSNWFNRISVNIGMALVMLTLLPGICHALTYATITDISACQMSNGVQIVIKADGILEYGYAYDSSTSNRVSLRLPGAKSSVKNFIDVSMYPVSYVQTSIPQDAKEGIGVAVAVGLFAPSSYSVSQSTDLQSVIITVNSKRTLETTEHAGTSSAEKQISELVCGCEDGLVSIHALKEGMLNVCGEIAKVSGINIVVDDAVAERVVSMTMDNATPEDMLKAITSAYGLAMAKNGDVYMISEGIPTDLATYRLSGTASFPMKYVQAQTASGLLPTFLYSYLHVNSEQNAVVVSAPTQMLEKIKSDLARVDIAPPQIMVDALAVEVSAGTDIAHSLGIAANWSTGQFSSNSEMGNINYSTIGKLPKEFLSNLKALVAENKAKIYANPRMAVLNGHSANIFIGAQRFIRVEYNSYGVKTESIKAVDVGTRITVTPWTGGNGEITTNISPEISNIVELDRETGLPTLSSRRASTTVRVKDGETIIIGGLTTKQDYDTKRKVPILGDLPVIGSLFRSRNKTSTETELLILITPRILSDSGHLPADEEKNIKDRMLGSEVTTKDTP